MKKNRPVLLTGAHRSGTTWLGKLLTFSSALKYVQEPFNLTLSKDNGLNLKYWYQSLDPEGDKEYILPASKAFKLAYYYERLFTNISSLKGFYWNILYWYRFHRDLRRGIRPLLKDPIALFSAEWIAKNFYADVIIIIRHPAAFAASVKRVGWTHEIVDLSKQDRLVNGVLAPIKEDLERLTKNPEDIIENASFMWKAMALQVIEYQRNHPEWIFVRHEDLSKDPVRRVRELYEMLELPFTTEISKKILELSGEDNPSEVLDSSATHQLHRNSKENIDSFKKRLSREEILRIKKLTSPECDYFYSDSDWGLDDED